MEAICGANCSECELFKSDKCKGCKNTNGCPFGKKCWIAKYIEVGGNDSFTEMKQQIINEFNDLNIAGMNEIKDLYPLHGLYVNLEYRLPNGEKIKFLTDEETYLGNQIECEFSDDNNKRYFGVVANMEFLLVSEYGENVSNPELIIYKKR